MKTTEVYNWSRYPRVLANQHSFTRVSELRDLLKRVPSLIARGSGLSYGDASLSGEVVSTLRFNKMLRFNRAAGVIRCESGVTLDEILQVIVPAGWFLPVTPGTKFITLGGAVAADVHGKNHHKEGSFSHYVKSLTIMGADGKITECSATKNQELFHLTCGGMGLTGVILEIEIELKKIESSLITQKNVPANNLQQLLDELRNYNHHTYSVAWIDCLSGGKNMGRGVLMIGEHALLNELPQSMHKQPLRLHTKPRLNVPFEMPSLMLNSITTRLFNNVYFNLKKLRDGRFFTHYDKFFYPLDFILHWNLLYGKPGFLQYQFVIPFDGGDRALHVILKKITESKLASFLAVLKVMGEAEHPLSFGMPGYTLALDFPISQQLFPLLEELDAVVADHGGKLYLAKDARMKQKVFSQSYAQYNEVKSKLKKYNGHVKFESFLSQRLSLTS
jgi:decaprenylphospho-beta-D-ribofuranose 2-oxidase